MSKDDSKHLNQEFDNKVLDLLKQKRFYSYEYMSGLENIKEELLNKEKLYSLLTRKKLLIKYINMFLRFGIDLK